ncbi:MAG: DUF3275 family protein [Betaproteobacteria bacterium]|nr:DUF3275 family protein [Betaproteobacteria bacterium]
MITVPGTLSIKAIHGRFGRFNVGRLAISIGEFVVKDAELDQYEEGVYQGDFIISEIKPFSYTTNGRFVIENRATLGGMTLSGIDDLSSEEAEKLTTQEVDPIETEAQQPAKAAPSKTKRHKAGTPDDMTPFGMEEKTQAQDTGIDDDEKLFGHLWPLGEVVKLDNTVDRMRLRKQMARLGELGYKFEPMSQDWQPKKL